MSWNENTRVEGGSGLEAEHVLDEGRDIAYQRREWIAQRIGWVTIALLVVAALLGLLGSVGPSATGTHDGVWTDRLTLTTRGWSGTTHLRGS